MGKRGISTVNSTMWSLWWTITAIAWYPVPWFSWVQIGHNLKTRGILENIQSSHLPHCVWELFQAVLSSLTSTDLTINRIPKPSLFPSQLPWDVLLYVHFYQVKKKLLQAFHKKDCLPEQAAGASRFFAHMQLQWKNLDTITRALRNHSFGYPWKYRTIRKNSSETKWFSDLASYVSPSI